MLALAVLLSRGAYFTSLLSMLFHARAMKRGLFELQGPSLRIRARGARFPVGLSAHVSLLSRHLHGIWKDGSSSMADTGVANGYKSSVFVSICPSHSNGVSGASLLERPMLGTHPLELEVYPPCPLLSSSRAFGSKLGPCEFRQGHSNGLLVPSPCHNCWRGLLHAQGVHRAWEARPPP